MFCPRCGQQQVSENTRFCSRCGFLLETVAEVLANGGVLPQLLALGEKKSFLTRKNGIVFSFLWLFFFVFLTAIGGMMDNDDFAGVMAIIGAFGWLITLFISLFLLKKTPNYLKELPAARPYANLSGASAANHLPPQQSQPVESYVAPAANWKAPNTGDFVRPPSVVEDTTKLLKKDE
jgi:hypothetical protein